ncbi:sensor histidine kinase [Pseudomonas fontis]|uniref:histidine kinase n=1 Tax=Pseudomonas fontis TaxID=2942633 RepID=A0ABT5P074_9PSED|nr:PAS domain S-box protein [Pseudomonas fontis]MDD0977288.1 PAS domain S-box protein [Pseudomonas fontis]MDD0993848.1 PAS domain S-box protein [Pseudomonas fontis]
MALLDKDPQPTVLLDAAATVLAANPALEALLPGWPRPAVQGLLPANHAALVSACLRQQRAIGEVEAQVGERILMWLFIPMDAGQVLARCRDATGERQAERDGIQARRLYRLITENTTDLISRHTPDGCFLDASPASYRLLGYWPEELRGVPVQSLFHPQDREQYLQQASLDLEQDGYQTMTCRVRHRDGRDLWFEIASRAIRETYTGAVVEIVSVSRDISQQRRHQDELAHTARLITLGELASGIAHEINQPLAAVVNYASASQRYLAALALDPQAAGKVAQGLQRISEQATHAAQVIKRLRAFLRKEPRRLQALSIAEVAREAGRLCAWEAAQAQVTIEAHIADSLPPVYADRVLLEQVLLNLLRNAIEANSEQHPGRASRVVLEGALVQGWLQIRVIDQGPGVDAERIDSIFTPFTTSKPEGLGLGLSMSRSIVEGFGGTLDASQGEAGGLVLSCRLAPVTSVLTRGG